LGLRVINPSLPGFGGSDPLPWEQVRMDVMADGLAQLLPRQRVAAAEARQARVDHPESKPSGEARALAPVDAAAGEEAVHVERPCRGLEVVGNGIAPATAVDHDR